MQRSTLAELAWIASAMLTLGPLIRTPLHAGNDEGYLFVTSWNNDSVLRYDAATGEYVDAIVPKRSGGLVHPWAVALSPNNGSLLVSSGHFVPGQFHGLIQYDGESGELVGQFTPKLGQSHAVTFGPDGNVYVGDRRSETEGAISRFDGHTGEYIDDFILPGSGGLVHPLAHVFGPSGRKPHEYDFFVTEEETRSIKRFDGASGQFIETFVDAGSGGMAAPFGLTFGPDGNLYVADDIASAILRFEGPNSNSPGSFIDAFIPPGAGGLLQPLGLLFGPDANGDDQQDLYVNSQTINPKSFLTMKETSSVKIYNGATGEYIRDFISADDNGCLEGPNLMTFTYTDPVTLEYICPPNLPATAAALPEPKTAALCLLSLIVVSSSRRSVHRPGKFEVSRLTVAVQARLPRRVSLFAAGLMALAVAVSSAVSAHAASELRYRISGDRLESFDGRQWTVTGGEMSMELFDDGSLELFGEGTEYAFYSVTSFSLDLVDQLGDTHSIVAAPDGLPGPISFDPVEIPESVLDIGVFTLYPLDANVELLVYDLSVDGQPVNSMDELGGPGFIDSYWIGNHLAPTMWSFASILFLPSLNVDAGEIYLVGELVPEPTTSSLCTIGLLAFYLRRHRAATSSRRRLSSKCRVFTESTDGADAVATK